MWRNKNLWILITGVLGAELGLWMGLIGNLEFLQTHVASHALQALLLISGPVVALLIAPYAGSAVDRYDKKKILLVTGAVRIIGVGSMFLAMWSGSVSLMVVYSLCIACSAGFYIPAVRALIPRVTDKEHLMQANALYFNVLTTARIVGTVLAGTLLTILSLEMLYSCAIIGYSLLLLFTLFLRVQESTRQREPNQKKSRGTFREVLPVISGNSLVKLVMISQVIPMIFIGGFNLIVMEISVLQGDPTIKGYLYAIEGIALILIGFFGKRLAQGRNVTVLIGVICSVVGLSQLLLFFAHSHWITMLSFALFGMASGIYFPLINTIFQQNIPEEFHGRFFSFSNMLERVVMNCTILLIGVLFDWVGLELALAGIGVSALLLTALLTLRMKRYAGTDMKQTSAVT
ncbi:MFS transporter [Tumebacillus algifaecis]